MDENKDKAVRDVMKMIFDDASKNIPVFIRVTLLLRAFRSKNATDADIKWDEVNEHIKNSPDYSTCYNIQEPEFHSIEELEHYIVNAQSASILDLAYRKCKCKDCGCEYTLTYNQIQWYIDKDLSVPKRCDGCRQSRNTKSNCKSKFSSVGEYTLGELIKKRGNKND